MPVSFNSNENNNGPSLDDMCLKYSKVKALTNQLRDELFDWLSIQTQENQKWFYRVFMKDLRLGIDLKTVNKAFPGLIPNYSIALADVYEEIKHQGQLANSVMDVKLDGIRALARVEANEVYIRSRNGKAIVNFPDISRELSELPNGWYDGEIYLHEENGFQKLSKYITRDEAAPSDLGVRFYIFDYLQPNEWIDGSEPTLEERKSRLNEMFNAEDTTEPLSTYNDHLGLVSTFECIDADTVNRYLDLAHAWGFEGMMIKIKSGQYLKKRSKNILKYKSFDSTEGEIISFVEGEGRLVGMLGKVMLKLPNGKIFGCGSGFTDKERTEIWNDQPKFLGKLVEVKFQELTKDGIPRFPTYLRIRYDL
jgi:DNA ligase-1